jgi:hypothetical protein
MAESAREPALHQAAGRLLASFEAKTWPLSYDEILRSTSLSTASVDAVLEWLRGLELIEETELRHQRLGRGRLRNQRRHFRLLLHLEPDAGVSSFCHVLLAEKGYPSIGAEDSPLASRLLASVEFDLAVLSAAGGTLSEFLDDEAELLRLLPPAPIILYGTEDDEAPAMVDSIAAILPGPLRGDVLLTAVQTLLPPDEPDAAELQF